MGEWDSEVGDYVWEEEEVYIYETIKIETYKLPTFNGGSGGQGVLPYST